MESQVSLRAAGPGRGLDLADWSSHQDGVRGRIRVAPGKPDPDRTGATLLGTLVVAGRAAAAPVLARALIVWLGQSRFGDVPVSVVAPDGSETVVTATNAREVETVLPAAVDN